MTTEDVLKELLSAGLSVTVLMQDGLAHVNVSKWRGAVPTTITGSHDGGDWQELLEDIYERVFLDDELKIKE